MAQMLFFALRRGDFERKEKIAKGGGKNRLLSLLAI
jgi:hypothetical protein